MVRAQKVKKLIRRLARRAGYDITGWYGTALDYPQDFTEDDARAIDRVRAHTMLSAEQLRVIRSAIRHVKDRGIPGALVECGVWKGGVLRLMADTAPGREVWGFDTFEGMTPRGPWDRLNCGKWPEWVRDLTGRDAVPIDQVRELVPEALLVKGDVAHTLPRHAPQQIAVLHLDTDLYESTKAELETLWPRLSPGGIMIVDDYGLWAGSRKALDEFLPGRFKVRIDQTAVLIEKAYKDCETA